MMDEEKFNFKFFLNQVLFIFHFKIEMANETELNYNWLNVAN